MHVHSLSLCIGSQASKSVRAGMGGADAPGTPRRTRTYLYCRRRAGQARSGESACQSESEEALAWNDSCWGLLQFQAVIFLVSSAVNQTLECPNFATVFSYFCSIPSGTRRYIALELGGSNKLSC